MTDTNHTLDMIDRLCRLSASLSWRDDLNPTQLAALGYLSRANRFSRAPSKVADYLAATRGTVSQTLKSLERKGMLVEHPSASDRRSVEYTLSKAGKAALDAESQLAEVLGGLPDEAASALSEGLGALLSGLLEARGGRSFGICRSCKHHEAGFCALLKVDLAPEEADQICHEHEGAKEKAPERGPGPDQDRKQSAGITPPFLPS